MGGARGGRGREACGTKTVGLDFIKKKKKT